MILDFILYPASGIRYPVSGIQHSVSSIRHPASCILHRFLLNKIYILILLFGFTSFSQTKYLIYFKDKGITPSQLLGKQNFEQAEKHLSKRSIDRRKKSMKNDYLTYEDLPLKKEYIDKLKLYGIKIKRELKWFNAVSAYLTDEQFNKISYLTFIKKIETVKILRSKSKLEWPEEKAIPDYTLLKTKAANEINYGASFSQLELIDIPKAHARGITGSNVIIGLLDTGFDWKDHESLVNSDVIAEYDFVFDDTITANQSGDSPTQHNHGTAVFSAVGGFKDSVLIGGSYNSSFVLAKTEDLRSETIVEEDNYAAALEWMDSIGVDITSSSLGYNEFDDPRTSYTYEDMDGKTTIVTRAAELAFSRGIVTITAAGNEGNTSWGYITAPADGFNTIAVGAVNSANIVANFSSFGPTSDGRVKPDIVAQGVQVYSANAVKYDSYIFQQGTSLATPLACSAASLLLSAYPHLLNTQIRSILLKTADNSREPNNDRGYGLVSVSRAISYPNLEFTGNQFRLHKIFLDNPDIDPSSVRVNYYAGTEDPLEGAMNYDGNLSYSFVFPLFAESQSVSFYFTFEDSTGRNLREPAAELYQFSYGDLIIISNSTNPTQPVDFYLGQNYPNPFPTPSNPVTIIKYQVPDEGFVTLKLYDILGNEVRTLVDGIMKRGSYEAKINSRELASGVYIYQLRIGIFSSVRKMIVLK